MQSCSHDGKDGLAARFSHLRGPRMFRLAAAVYTAFFYSLVWDETSVLFQKKHSTEQAVTSSNARVQTKCAFLVARDEASLDSFITAIVRCSHLVLSNIELCSDHRERKQLAELSGRHFSCVPPASRVLRRVVESSSREHLSLPL